MQTDPYPLDSPGAADTHNTLARVRRILTHAAVSAWAISALIHLVLLLLAAAITFAPAQAGGARGDGEFEVEMAVITEAELVEIEQAMLDAQMPLMPDLPMPDVPIPDALAKDIGDELSNLTDVTDVTVGIGGGDLAGDMGGLSGAGGGAAKFFGVEARGNRFAYIVDVSGSMSVEGKVQNLQRQLVSSINALIETASFCVIAFNHQAWPLGGEVKWMPASVSARRDAVRQIEQMRADGGTEPMQSFQMVFGLRPKPDAIYFMTDGEFNPDYADAIAKLNRDPKTPIHCIAYASNAAEAVMQKIARESGGSYTFVPGGSP